LGASIRILKKISEGSITGIKISENEWRIDLNVSAIDEETDIKITAKTSANFIQSAFQGIWMPIYTY